MDGRETEKDSFGGKHHPDCEMDGSKNSLQNKSNHDYDLTATTLPNSEISQVEDAYSNSTSLTLTNETGKNDEDQNSTSADMEICSCIGENQPDASELENSTGENMTIYEDPGSENDGNCNEALCNQTQAVPECASSGPASSTNVLPYNIGDNVEMEGYAALLQEKLDTWIARIDDHWQGRCDVTEQQLQASLSGVSILELQEKFGIAETQIELINDILEEIKRKGNKTD